MLSRVNLQTILNRFGFITILIITRQITEPTTTIDIRALPSGVYVVRVTGERTVEVGKFIKN